MMLWGMGSQHGAVVWHQLIQPQSPKKPHNWHTSWVVTAGGIVMIYLGQTMILLAWGLNMLSHLASTNSTQVFKEPSLSTHQRSCQSWQGWRHFGLGRQWCCRAWGHNMVQPLGCDWFNPIFKCNFTIDTQAGFESWLLEPDIIDHRGDNDNLTVADNYDGGHGVTTCWRGMAW